MKDSNDIKMIINGIKRLYFIWNNQVTLYVIVVV